MKLKKIAALALAGVMAVSMLAGCAGKGTDDKKDPTTGTSTAFTNSVVAALQKKVEAYKDYVTVSTDANLQKNLESATALYGMIASEGNIETVMQSLDSSLSTTALPAVNTTTTAYKDASATQTVFSVAVVNYDNNKTDYAAVQEMINTIAVNDKTLGSNDTKNLMDTIKYGKSYGAYSSTGLDGKQSFTGLNFKYQINVATVKVENTAVEGSGRYVVAFTVTRTATPVSTDDANFGTPSAKV